MDNSLIKITDLSFSYPDKCVIDSLALDIPHGISAIMGESGSGKSTLLDIIASLTKCDFGKVTFEGFEKAPKISYMMQDTTLLPWLSSLDNVNLVLSDSAETLDEAKMWLSAVELDPERDFFLMPHELSGGMKQRVALARTLAAKADIYLFDEALRGLDYELKLRMASLIRERVASLSANAIFVTHDKEEAELMAKTCFVFDSTPLGKYNTVYFN